MKTEWNGKLFVGILGQAPRESPFLTAREDSVSYVSGWLQAPSYRLAYDDFDFIMPDEPMPVRLQLERKHPLPPPLEKGD